MTEDQEQRLKQIRERVENVRPEEPLPLQVLLDANELLVMLDSLTAGDGSTFYYNEDGSYNPIGKNIAEHAATQMRDACVEKVKVIAEAWLGDSRTEPNTERSNVFYERCCAACVIAKELQSLTPNHLNQVPRHQFRPVDNNPGFCDECGWSKTDCEAKSKEGSET